MRMHQKKDPHTKYLIREHSGYALITGASSGIGKSFAEKLAAEKINLVLTARDKPRLEELSDGLREKFKITTLIIARDLALPESPAEIAAIIAKNSIEIDILINNAGFNEYGPFLKTDLEKELRMIQLNIASLTSLTKFLLPGMKERKYGKVLNIGSTGSFAPGVFNAVYCATKAFVLSFSEAIAEELKGTGVTVTALCPGPTQTEFAGRAGMTDVKIFQSRLLEPDAVAAAGLASMRAGKSTAVAGLANKLLVFSLRLTPRSMVTKISKGLMRRV